MYNIRGLSTPRGSGTNGFVQSNKFFVKRKNINSDGQLAKRIGVEAQIRKPNNKDIVEHNRKRQMELKLLLLQERLSQHGYTDTEIAEKLHRALVTLQSAAAV